MSPEATSYLSRPALRRLLFAARERFERNAGPHGRLLLEELTPDESMSLLTDATPLDADPLEAPSELDNRIAEEPPLDTERPAAPRSPPSGSGGDGDRG